MADPKVSCPIFEYTGRLYPRNGNVFRRTLLTDKKMPPFPGCRSRGSLHLQSHPQGEVSTVCILVSDAVLLTYASARQSIFTDNPPCKEQNITIDRFPVGTGPYRIDTLIAHKEIVLVKNENFRIERYPSEWRIAAIEKRDLLDDAAENHSLYTKSRLQIRKRIHSTLE